MESTEALLASLGARIHELRRARKWTRQALCERCGVSVRFLAEVEAGRGNPSVRSLADIAGALDTSAAALLTPHASVVSLLGLRGAGKSTVGKALARKMRVPFVELDGRIEEAAGLSLTELFELHGERYYRRLEREVLATFLGSSPRAVLATGGSLVTDHETFELLLERTTTVWLRARPEVHWNRVVTQGDHRPMANDPLAMERLRTLLAERESLYARAHHVVDVSDRDVRSVVRAIDHVLGG